MSQTDIVGLLDGQFTLGIEEEFQIVHHETRELHSYISQIIDEAPVGSILRERVQDDGPARGRVLRRLQGLPAA